MQQQQQQSSIRDNADISGSEVHPDHPEPKKATITRNIVFVTSEVGAARILMQATYACMRAISVPYACHVRAMRVPCACHARAMCVPCACHVRAIYVPYACHVHAMHVLYWLPRELNALPSPR